VIGSSSGLMIDKAFLESLHAYWFEQSIILRT